MYYFIADNNYSRGIKSRLLFFKIDLFYYIIYIQTYVYDVSMCICDTESCFMISPFYNSFYLFNTLVLVNEILIVTLQLYKKSTFVLLYKSRSVGILFF